jgi:hypothetical protein
MEDDPLAAQGPRSDVESTAESHTVIDVFPFFDMDPQTAPVLGLMETHSGRLTEHVESKIGHTIHRTKKWATFADWKHHRAEITRLYRDENRVLRDVVEIMQEKHDFQAT